MGIDQTSSYNSSRETMSFLSAKFYSQSDVDMRAVLNLARWRQRGHGCCKAPTLAASPARRFFVDCSIHVVGICGVFRDKVTKN
jgi:hypothetical protein